MTEDRESKRPYIENANGHRTWIDFTIGDHVMKIGEDSRFEGHVVGVFIKLNGKTVRYVVENEDGVLHIASSKQLHWLATSSPTSQIFEGQTIK